MPRSLAPTKRRTPRRAGAVLILLTPEERKAARAVAEAIGMPLATWIRVTILRDVAEAQRARRA